MLIILECSSLQLRILFWRWKNKRHTNTNTHTITSIKMAFYEALKNLFSDLNVREISIRNFVDLYHWCSIRIHMHKTNPKWTVRKTTIKLLDIAKIWIYDIDVNLHGRDIFMIFFLWKVIKMMMKKMEASKCQFISIQINFGEFLGWHIEFSKGSAWV